MQILIWPTYTNVAIGCTGNLPPLLLVSVAQLYFTEMDILRLCGHLLA